MKINIACITLLLVLFVGTSFSQDFPTDKGSKIVFGNVAFSSMGGDLYENSDGDRSTTIMATPSLTYFVSPGLAIGGKGLFNRSAQGDDSQTTLGIGPHIIFFIGGNKKPSTIKGTTYPYLGAAFLYMRSTYKSTWEDYDPWSGSTTKETSESTTSGTAISLGFGIMHMLSNTIGLTGEFAYEIDNLKHEDADKSTSGNKFNILVGISAFLY